VVTSGGVAAGARLPVLVGVTGHRDLRAEDASALRRAVGDILDAIARELPSTPLVVLSPLAEGADQLVAREGLARGLSLMVPLPMPRDLYLAGFESEVARRAFDELAAQAERVFELPLAPGVDRAALGSDRVARRRQYEQLGVFLVRHAQILVALWDGHASDDPGGTAHVVGLTLSGGAAREPEQGGAAALDTWDRGPCHAVLAPRRSGPAPAGAPGETRLLVPETLDGAERARERHRAILSRIDLLNAEIVAGGAALAEEAQCSAAALLPEEVRRALGAKEREILQRFAVADVLAARMQSGYRRGLFALLALVVLAMAGFEVYDNLLPEEDAGLASLLVLAFYPVALGLAFAGYALVRRREYQDKHLDYRALAEGLRVQLFWRLAGLAADVSDHYLRKQSGELRWIHEAIRVSNVPASPEDAGAVRGGAEHVQAHWILAQRHYYVAAAQRDARRLRRDSRLAAALYVGSLCTTLGVLAIDGASRLLLQSAPLAGLRPYLFVAIALLLGGSAVVRGYVERMGYSEQALQYQRMRDLFARAHASAGAALERGDRGAAQHIFLGAGEEALQENADWVLFRRSRGIELPQ
jgi:hypothetical protein